ncbi:MAG: DUF222 domain-containing protein [Humibacter sp.]
MDEVAWNDELEWDDAPAWEECDDDERFPLDAPRSPTSTVSAETVIGFAFDDAVASQTMVNQQAARQVFAVHEAFEIARENPLIYVPVGAADRVPGVTDIDFAERSVAFDLAQRLHLSENVVRSFAQQGEVLRASLPRLLDLFVSGRIGPQHARAAVEASIGITTEAAMEQYDVRLSSVAEGLRPGEFARRCRVLRERLCADTLQERHEIARERRRVVIEPAEDAMAWIHAYVPVLDAARVDAQLTGAAKQLRKEAGEHRNLDQLRADLLVGWLSGDGTPSAVAAQPYVLMDDAGRFAELLGYGPIPPRAAGAALRDAPAFRRVLADPVRPAQLTLDTTRYKPSPDQRRWLTLRYGLDDAAAPFIAPGAEIDHVVEWQHGGTTDVANLLPLKPRLHRLKSVTRIRLDPKPDGGIRVRTPTGYDSDPPPF